MRRILFHSCQKSIYETVERRYDVPGSVLHELVRLSLLRISKPLQSAHDEMLRRIPEGVREYIELATKYCLFGGGSVLEARSIKRPFWDGEYWAAGLPDSFEGLLFSIVERDLYTPKRFMQAFCIDHLTMARLANIEFLEIEAAPRSGKLQAFVRDAMTVTEAVVDMGGKVSDVVDWFVRQRVPSFDNKTPAELVGEGRTIDLMRYLQSWEAGFQG